MSIQLVDPTRFPFPVNANRLMTPYEEFGRHLSAEVPRRLNRAASVKCGPDPQGDKTRIAGEAENHGVEIIEELINGS